MAVLGGECENTQEAGTCVGDRKMANEQPGEEETQSFSNEERRLAWKICGAGDCGAASDGCHPKKFEKKGPS
jgi:hypothetical protein